MERSCAVARGKDINSGIVEVYGRNLGVEGEGVYSCGEGAEGCDAMAHPARRNPPKTFVRGDVVSTHNARCEFRPSTVVVVRKDPHAAVPASPKYFDGTAASSVVAKGKSVSLPIACLSNSSWNPSRPSYVLG
jgi:hypothetical protein